MNNKRTVGSATLVSIKQSQSKLFSTTTTTSSTENPTNDVDVVVDDNLIPVTLLSGFLGSGKTSTLQHLLENTDGLRIGVIVNDMASVNIDAKLISKSTGGGNGGGDDSSSNNGVVELQNGCACCSLADELLTTIEDLVDSRSSSSEDTTSNAFDAIVVELSGVADPIAIKQNWKNAQMTDQSVTKKADMKRIVTLIDSSTFGTDWMTWDDVGERGWVDPILEDGCTSQRKVPELLAEQIEAADVLLLNKIDLAGPKQVQIAKELAKQINKNAIIEEVEFGKVSSPKQIIREDVNSITIKDEDEEASSCNDPGCDDHSHSHSHSHSHAEKEEDSSSSSSSSCKDKDCGDPDCDEHGTTATATVDSACIDTDCTDTSHDHSHSHATAAVDSSCSDPDCGDPNCDEHGSDDSTTAAAACTDTDCTDTTHDHSHASHSHSTSTDNLGIVNFVYKADRPFQTQNLMSLLNTWPVPIKENLEDLLQYEVEDEDPSSQSSSPGNDTRESPFSGVLRSKGFCWLAPTKWSPDKVGNNKSQGDQWRHDTAMYWSHAGRHFGISTAGKWWATLPKKDIKEFFKDDPTEYERIMTEDFQKDSTYGDRRQEIVFIGININEEEITKSLDNCLVGKEKGMERYSQQLNNYMETISDISE